ncbi:transposase [Bradyrhizobium tunisiense]|uniref:transposase n=1 Tax=Bradyrhizobium tunisiense TaxID=3278709 RepID=UPI0035D83F81
MLGNIEATDALDAGEGGDPDPEFLSIELLRKRSAHREKRQSSYTQKNCRQVRRLEIVETGWRRRWSAAEKLRIVEESFSGPRLVSATVPHHGLSKRLLFSWREPYREG